MSDKMDRLSHAIITRGWKTLQAHPIDGVVVGPSATSMYVWHGTVTSPHPEDEGLTFGFKIIMDER